MSRQEIENKIARLQRELDQATKQLIQMDRTCGHVFGETEPAHIHHPGYRVEGDPVGTMGVDWRGPCYVSARTEERWKRVCIKCGKVEYTNRTVEEKSKKPVW